MGSACVFRISVLETQRFELSSQLESIGPEISSATQQIQQYQQQIQYLTGQLTVSKQCKHSG